METKTTRPSVKDITPAIKSAVAAVLLAKKFAAVEREKINKVERDVLSGIEIWTSAKWGDRIPSHRITNPADLYMADADSEPVKWYYEEMQKEIDAMGYKLPVGHCPALCAESLLRDAEHLLIKAAAPVFNVTLDQILCSKGNLENLRKYIDLLCGLVVSLPDFKNPLTGKAVES